MKLLPLAALLFSACNPKVPAPGDSSDSGTDSADTGTRDTSDTGADCPEPSNDKGQDFEKLEQQVTAVIDGRSWTGTQGSFYPGECSSQLDATRVSGQTAEKLSIAVEGDLRWAGSYPVTLIGYSIAPSQAPMTNYYTIENPQGMVLTVDGFADDIWLFGSVSGSATLEDTIDTGSITLEGIEIQSWPQF